MITLNSDIDRILESHVDRFDGYDVLEEDYWVDPMYLFEELDPMDYTFTEATKGNVLTRLLEALKKAMTWIVKQVKRLVHFITSFFHEGKKKKKKKKSADQVSDEVKLPSQPPNPDAKPVEVQIPANPDSEVSLDPVKVIAKQIKVAFSEDKDSVTLEMKSGKAVGGKDSSLPAQSRIGHSHFITAIYLMKNHAELRELEEISAKIKARKYNDTDMLSRSIKLHDRMVTNVMKHPSVNAGQVSFTLVDLQSFLRTFLTINDNLSGLFNAETAGLPSNSLFVRVVNILTNDLLRIQMGINDISGAMAAVYVIDKSHLSVIESVDDLARFVRSMINAGIPGKYICYNAYLASKPAIKGDGSKGDAEHPIWGQTRAVFFPTASPDRVIKIALGGLGVSSNRCEVSVTNLFRKLNASNIIAEVLTSYEDGYVIASERVADKDQNGRSGSVMEVQKVLVRLKKEHNLNIEISDIHYKNVGIKNGTSCIIDYGQLLRLSMNGSHEL